MNMKLFATPLLGTALTLTLASHAGAATEVEIDDNAKAQLSEECANLVDEVRSMNNMVADDQARDVVDALNNDASQECATLAENLTPPDAMDEEQATASDTATETASDSETAEVDERVTVEEEATIEGEAVVRVPDPNVDVQVPPPNVTVQKTQPDVQISEKPSQIEVRQEQPQVRVQIPEIIVQVDIPAPSIFIRSEDPDVRISAGDPQIEIEQGEPRVTVRQADPELDIALDIEDGAAEEQSDTQQQASNDGGASADSDVEVMSDQPQITYVQPEGEPTFSFQSAEAEVMYESAEPQVSVEFTQEPTVQINQTGEPTVTYETAEQRQQRKSQQDQQQASAQSGNQGSSAGNDANTGGTGETTTVADLLEMIVIDAEGNEIGQPQAFLEREGEFQMVLPEGGFLGFGEEEVAIPMDRVRLDGDRLVLLEMTEEDIEQASSVNYEDSQELPRDAEVRTD